MCRVSVWLRRVQWARLSSTASASVGRHQSIGFTDSRRREFVGTKQVSDIVDGYIYQKPPCLSSNYFSPSVHASIHPTIAKITRANKRLGCMALHHSVQLLRVLIRSNPKRRFSPADGVIASATCLSVCTIICYLFIIIAVHGHLVGAIESRPSPKMAS